MRKYKTVHVKEHERVIKVKKEKKTPFQQAIDEGRKNFKKAMRG
ncbi:MAG: hypothetical protein ABR954_10450 [Dehalococcoidales bacterium]